MSEERDENDMKERDGGRLVLIQFWGSSTERNILNGMAKEKGVSRGKLILGAIENQPDIPFGEIKAELLELGPELNAALHGNAGKADKLSAIAKCADVYAKLASATGGEE
ncbi:MAG: hypothetical protein LUD47_00895 [Clostridia bacterium]|nr:hypothetical protein [Clostridia bacterium]